jgi:hypothetical protein
MRGFGNPRSLGRVGGVRSLAARHGRARRGRAQCAARPVDTRAAPRVRCIRARSISSR